MMDFETLKTLTDLKYQKSQEGLPKILARERKLRDEIDRLRIHAFQARALPADKPAMQNIGADVIWLKWVSQAIERLNIELAQVLAQKETLQAKQRKAFGQKTVAGFLQKEATREEASKKAAKSLAVAIESALLISNRR